MARLVQFMHPGGEPRIPASGRKPWNEGHHARCFLKSRGHFLSDSAGQQRGEDDLVFWGEWEAPAEAQRLNSGGNGLPTWVCTPKLSSSASVQQPQNTDPFVFGNTFMYSCCKQVRRNGSATVLRDLQRGDVILFGSQLDGRFVLDTVFVVARSELFVASRGAESFPGRVPEEFVEAALRPLARAMRLDSADAKVGLNGCGPEDWNPEDEQHAACATACAPIGTQYRLYWGATPDEPVEGMFSFAPAQLAAQSRAGFPRPAIDTDFIKNTLPMGFKTCLEDRGGSHRTVKAAWEEVVRLVIQKDHLIGFQFALPEWERANV